MRDPKRGDRAEGWTDLHNRAISPSGHVFYNLPLLLFLNTNLSCLSDKRPENNLAQANAAVLYLQSAQ